MIRFNSMVRLVIVGLLSFHASVGWSLEPYRWQRTGQTLAARSRVDVTAQGASDFFDENPTPTNAGFIGILASAAISRPALGGGGGGGGDTGFIGPFALNGLDGNDADPVPGEDGIGDDYAGKGGQPGDDGSGVTLYALLA